MIIEEQPASGWVGEIENFSFVELEDGNFKCKCPGDRQNFRIGNGPVLTTL